MAEIKEALEAQRQALDELKIESEDLYKAAIAPDTDLFPFQHQGPCYTPPIPNYEAPDGKYNDITRVYTQWGVFQVCTGSEEWGLGFSAKTHINIMYNSLEH